MGRQSMSKVAGWAIKCTGGLINSERANAGVVAVD